MLGSRLGLAGSDCALARLPGIGVHHDVQFVHDLEVDVANLSVHQRSCRTNIASQCHADGSINRRLIGRPVLVHQITSGALIIFQWRGSIGCIRFFRLSTVFTRVRDDLILDALRRVGGHCRQQAIEVTVLRDGIGLGFTGLANRHQVIGKREFEAVRKVADALTADDAYHERDERTECKRDEQLGGQFGVVEPVHDKILGRESWGRLHYRRVHASI